MLIVVFQKDLFDDSKEDEVSRVISCLSKEYMPKYSGVKVN